MWKKSSTVLQPILEYYNQGCTNLYPRSNYSDFTLSLASLLQQSTLQTLIWITGMIFLLLKCQRVSILSTKRHFNHSFSQVPYLNSSRKSISSDIFPLFQLEFLSTKCSFSPIPLSFEIIDLLLFAAWPRVELKWQYLNFRLNMGLGGHGHFYLHENCFVPGCFKRCQSSFFRLYVFLSWTS